MTYRQVKQPDRDRGAHRFCRGALCCVVVDEGISTTASELELFGVGIPMSCAE